MGSHSHGGDGQQLWRDHYCPTNAAEGSNGKEMYCGCLQDRKLSGGCVEMDLYSSFNLVTIINPVEEQSKLSVCLCVS